MIDSTCKFKIPGTELGFNTLAEVYKHEANNYVSAYKQWEDNLVLAYNRIRAVYASDIDGVTTEQLTIATTAYKTLLDTFSPGTPVVTLTKDNYQEQLNTKLPELFKIMPIINNAADYDTILATAAAKENVIAVKEKLLQDLTRLESVAKYIPFSLSTIQNYNTLVNKYSSMEDTDISKLEQLHKMRNIAREYFAPTSARTMYKNIKSAVDALLSNPNRKEFLTVYKPTSFNPKTASLADLLYLKIKYEYNTNNTVANQAINTELQARLDLNTFEAVYTNTGQSYLGPLDTGLIIAFNKTNARALEAQQQIDTILNTDADEFTSTVELPISYAALKQMQPLNKYQFMEFYSQLAPENKVTLVDLINSEVGGVINLDSTKQLQEIVDTVPNTNITVDKIKELISLTINQAVCPL